jgi:rfaE bifunctional protein kinase chain/domain
MTAELFPGKHVIVLGDVMLDALLAGRVTRTLADGGAPIVDCAEQSFLPGGAANAAASIAAMGGRVTLLGVIGDDPAGDQVGRVLRARGIDPGGLLLVPQRPTTQKLRLAVADGLLARVDVETRAPVDAAIERGLIDAFVRLLEDADVALLSDYDKGVVTPAVARACLAACARRRLPVVVDPKGADFAKYAGASVVTPNLAELAVAAGHPVPHGDGPIAAAAFAVMARLGGGALLVTRGAQGMTLVEADCLPVHVPAEVQPVRERDAIGAGDTVAGAMALGLAAGMPLREAALAANHAAAAAVSMAAATAGSRAGVPWSHRDEAIE